MKRALVPIARSPAEVKREIKERMKSPAWKKLDAIEEGMAKGKTVKFKTNHVFTPGIYVREIFIPKGVMVTSRIHLTEHPFIISAGTISIWTEEYGCVTLSAPYTGVTKPATRRLLYAHSDVIFSTIHSNPTNETDPDKLVMKLTYTGGKFSKIGGAKA